MPRLEEALLRYLAREVFCSIADLETVIAEHPDGADEPPEVTVVRLLTEWEDRGWAETAEMDPGGQVTLTEKAYEELPWLPRPD
jgi:hypothetical protein